MKKYINKLYGWVLKDCGERSSCEPVIQEKANKRNIKKFGPHKKPDISAGMWRYGQEVEKYIKYMPYNNFEYAVNISLKNKYIYVENPKVGCSTIKDTLQRMDLEYAELKRDDPDDIHNRKYSPLLMPSQTCGLDRLINNPDYFSFCFVRNPYARLLSAFLEKIEKNKQVKWSILYAMGEDSTNLSKKISFEEFVDVVCELDVYDMDPHWRIQYFHTFQNLVDYDYIGRMESFDKDISYVLSRLVDNHRDYYRPEVRHSTNSSYLYKQYYNDVIQEKVFNKYKIDFDYFGYKLDIFS